LIASNVVGTYSGNIILTSGTATATMPTQINNTVTPAPLTVTVVNKAKLYLIANPQLTVTYSGFVNGDGPSVLTTQPSITTTATVTSPTGQYPITASGAIGANYTITYVPGVLNVYPVIIIPSAFTPNGDGINDRWEITYLNAFEGAVLQVYNRYGQLVYKSIGYNTPWDGTENGQAIPSGTYYYVITVGEGSKPMSGYLQIIR
jgi:gliding motility-associated-like protein